MAFEVVQYGTCRIAIIRIVNPPVNAVSVAVRQMILDAMRNLTSDASLDAAVLCGAGRHFASAIPLNEVEDGIAAPSLGEVCQAIEMSAKPVVVLMQGHVAAAGLELALAAHGRVATPGAKLGMPDFRLGLSPGGGATQRLPRLIGAGGALEMLLKADPHFATADLCRPLVDVMSSDAVALEDALRMAQDLAMRGDWQRTRDRVDGLADPLAFQRDIKAWRERFVAAPGDTSARIIEAVEAAQLLPFEAGLALERACFTDLVGSTRSRGLRRSRRAEQQANRLTPMTAPQVNRIAVMGLPQQVIRTAGAALFGGAEVTLFDPDRAEDLRRDLLARSARALAARGASAYAEAEARLTAAQDPAALAGCQVVFLMSGAASDGVTRDLTRIAPHLSPDAVALCQSERADFQSLVPEAMIGRAFALCLTDRDFPARAAEVSVPDNAPAAALATAQGSLWRLNRLVVRGRAGRSMMVPVLFDALMAAVDGLVRGGIAPSRIEAALTGQGFARSPYAMVMQADGQAYLTRTLSRRPQMGLSHRILIDALTPTDRGKTSVMLDYAAAGMVEGEAVSLDDAGIAGAISAAMANAGCRLLAEGSALRPMQIDALMLHGFGYPRSTGGPMAEADMTGLAHVVARCRQLENLDPGVWAPHPMLLDFTDNDLGFLDLDHRDPGMRAA